MFVDKDLIREIEWEEPKMSIKDKWFFAAEIFTLTSLVLSVLGLLT